MNEWISVKDRLPDKNEHDSVLITDGTSTYVAVEWSEEERGVKWTYSYCCGCLTAKITHWMSLPEPPEEKE